MYYEARETSTLTRIFVNLAFVFLFSVPAFGQWEDSYSPSSPYSESSRELISALKSQVQDELRSMDKKERQTAITTYWQTTDFLIRLVRRKAFLKNELLESQLNRVLQNIVEKNQLIHLPERILILRSPAVNAFSVGEGTFVITLGLLARLQNEGQLAFALAHEVGHYELGHTKSRVLKENNREALAKKREEIAKIRSGKITEEELDQFRQSLFDMSRFSREHESEADSAGLVFFLKTEYNPPDALALFGLLDTTVPPPNDPGDELFLRLDFKNYPFQHRWLQERLSIFKRKSRGTFFFTADSLSSHSDLELRKNKLATKVPVKPRLRNGFDFSMIRELSTFEVIESSYRSGQFDYSLFHALKLLKRYPRNTYLITTIGKILTLLYEARNINQAGSLFSTYTGNYDSTLRKVNNFMHNISTEELGEVAYHFLNNDANFNEDEEQHYYWLWRICTDTNRYDMESKVKDAYRERFDKNPNTYTLFHQE